MTTRSEKMFLRLQNGTSLKAQEKRNAYPGHMRAFVHKLASHPFFSRVGFANSRFNHDLVAAQIVCLELAGEPTNVKNADLNRMYKENADFDPKCQDARTSSASSQFWRTYSERRLQSLSVTMSFRSTVWSLNFFDNTPSKMSGHFCTTGSYRSKAFAAIKRLNLRTRVTLEWTTYKEKISHSTDAADSIRSRMDFMLLHLLETYPKIPS